MKNQRLPEGCLCRQWVVKSRVVRVSNRPLNRRIRRLISHCSRCPQSSKLRIASRQQLLDNRTFIHHRPTLFRSFVSKAHFSFDLCPPSRLCCFFMSLLLRL